MKFEDLIDVIGDSDYNVATLVDDEWAGIFTIDHIPENYYNFIVEAIAPAVFEGSSPFDGVVLKVWLKEDYFRVKPPLEEVLDNR